MGDLQDEVRRRKTWFYETQLRRLNLEGFREVRPDQPGPLLDLISEQQLTVGFLGSSAAWKTWAESTATASNRCGQLMTLRDTMP